MADDEGQTQAVRHKWPDRLFHWTMAISVLVLLFSAFLPIAGIQFDWVPWHWIAGVCLTALLMLHILRVVFAQEFRAMVPGSADIRQVWSESRGSTSGKAGSTLPPAKYDAYQKAYHWLIALVVLPLIATGVPMLLKLDTVFWDRDPGLFSDSQWGYIYVAHGAFSLALIFLVILHIYFSLLPEHKKLLLSMITGRGPRFAREPGSNGTAVETQRAPEHDGVELQRKTPHG